MQGTNDDLEGEANLSCLGIGKVKGYGEKFLLCFPQP